jgi:diguanylate cyclase (GGDEF)-like protein
VYLHAVLNREIKLRRPGQTLALLLLDIQGFAAYNRHFGVSAGDELLQRLAIWFAGQLRPQDVICRYSGDCFIVLLPDTPLSSAELLAQHLQSQLQHICTEPLVLQTVVQPVQEQTAAAALQQLEQCLLQAKTQPASRDDAYSRVWY